MLIFGFTYYNQQISQLNADIDAQIDIFANLGVLLPSVKDLELQQKLNDIFKQEYFAEDRVRAFSYIITDTEGNVLVTRGVDPKLDAKINSLDIIVNENVENSLTIDEKTLLRSTLARMTEKNLPKDVPVRQHNGYIYYGDAASDEIARLPFVITDADGRPQKWQIWGDIVTADEATSAERERAEIFVQNAPGSSMIETTSEGAGFYFYYERKPYYG